MDLPDKHPAGGEAASATAGGSLCLPSKKLRAAREKPGAAPVGARTASTHEVTKDIGLRRFFLGASGRTGTRPFVLGGMRADDSTDDGQRSRGNLRSKNKITGLPDAQGLGK